MSRILRLPETLQKVGLSKSSIYALLKKNEFVKKISLGERSIGFLESDVEQWIENKAAQSKRDLFNK